MRITVKFKDKQELERELHRWGRSTGDSASVLAPLKEETPKNGFSDPPKKD